MQEDISGEQLKMSTYVDPSLWPFRGQRYCHLLADTLEELHQLADQIGMKRSWFQVSAFGIPHYDLSPGMRVKAITAGAKEITIHECSELQKRLPRVPIPSGDDGPTQEEWPEG